MNRISTSLSFSACLVAGSLALGCSTGDDGGDDNPNPAPTGTGGSGAGGAANKATVLYSFDSDLETFSFNNVVSDNEYINLVAPGTVDVPSPPPVLEWSSKDYDANAATPGSLKITGTWGSWQQSVTVEAAAPVDDIGATVDFSGKILRARVFLEKGLSDFMDAPGGAVFFVKTGTDYAWGQAPWKNLDTKGSWVDVRFDMTAPDSGSKPEFDPSKPVQLGIKIDSGGGNMHTADEYMDTETVVYIDQITMETKP
jgi:hypothetical protein